MDESFALLVRPSAELQRESQDIKRRAIAIDKRASAGARRLRQYLDAHAMTPQRFGEWMRPPVNKRKVQRWCKGDTKPSLTEAVEIERLTKIVQPKHWAREGAVL